MNSQPLIFILIDLAVSLEHLAVFPPVGQDEPWIAAAPYKLAAEGVCGNQFMLAQPSAWKALSR